ncbi:hypothetical protein [Streptomyces sp. NPDC101115]|uniref:hypothetical protein n=1 Tax=Streptomyces sp. NPDC101115 TaxID=3366106 RepID=UPI0037FDEF51
MSHELLTVCLPPMEVRAIPEGIGRAMAPFDMNGDHEPWQGEWDAWGIGGSAPFEVRPEAESDPRLIRVEDTPGHSARPPLPPSLCDGGPRRLLDLDTRREAVAARAREDWRTWHDFARAFPPARTMNELRQEFCALHGAGPDDRFRGQFEEQEVIRAITESPAVLALTTGMYDPVQQFAEPEEVHVDRLRSRVNTTDALLTLDGRWLDTSAPSYFAFADAYLLRVPEDCFLVRVRFHC